MNTMKMTTCLKCFGDGEYMVEDSRAIDCRFCSGGGLNDGELCHECDGTGDEIIPEVKRICATCKGTGEVLDPAYL